METTTIKKTVEQTENPWEGFNEAAGSMRSIR